VVVAAPHRSSLSDGKSVFLILAIVVHLAGVSPAQLAEGKLTLTPEMAKAIDRAFPPFAVAPERQELMEALDAGLKGLKENGEYDRIHKDWFGEN
jgi:ABC-type amino acid transport substrate-binding protein